MILMILYDFDKKSGANDRYKCIFPSPFKKIMTDWPINRMANRRTRCGGWQGSYKPPTFNYLYFRGIHRSYSRFKGRSVVFGLQCPSVVIVNAALAGYLSGFRIRSDIDRIRIQPLRTNRIHDFFKTESGLS